MSSTSSPFGQNEWLVEEMYRKFRDDPSSVDPSWHEFLIDYRPEPTNVGSQTPPTNVGKNKSSAITGENGPNVRRCWSDPTDGPS